MLLDLGEGSAPMAEPEAEPEAGPQVDSVAVASDEIRPGDISKLPTQIETLYRREGNGNAT